MRSAPHAASIAGISCSTTDRCHLVCLTVKLTEEVDVESDIYYPITCGETKALLVWKKFVCPGINIKCIQVGRFLKITQVFC